MKILQLNTTNAFGGAAVMMQSLSAGLRSKGHESEILVGYQTRNDDDVNILYKHTMRHRRIGDKIMDRIGNILADDMDIEALPFRNSFLLPKTEIFRKSDVIHIHNLHGGYFNYEALANFPDDKPIVWTLHDMNSFTGHCSHSGECEKYIAGCDESCPIPYKYPILKPRLIRKRWMTMRDFIVGKKRLIAVAPSRWMAAKAKEGLWREGRVELIPHGIDVETFYPISKDVGRKSLGIEGFDRYIMFGSKSMKDRHKGFERFLSALSRYSKRSSSLRTCLLTFGEKSGTPILESPSLKVVHLGVIGDARLLRLAYSCADIFVLTSLAETLGLVAMEAMACGTPCVAFDVGGVPDMVKHMSTGYLAKYLDDEDVANGMELLLSDSPLRNKLAANGIELIRREFTTERMIRDYIEIYTQLSEQSMSAKECTTP